LEKRVSCHGFVRRQAQVHVLERKSLTQFLVIEELANIVVKVVKHFHLEQQRQLEWIEVLQKVREISSDDVHDRPREVEVSFFQELQEVSKENIKFYYPCLY
jgi:hypothetical protein